VGGSVSISTELKPPGNDGIVYVRISVRDSGVGISADDLLKLFKPFERIGADKTETEGTGLGLTVVKKLVEAMGGKIGVESVLGIGSTFWIELPRIQPHGNSDEKTDGGLNMISGISEKKGTILYLEDNISNAELVEGILENYRPGTTLVTTMFGKDAINFAVMFKPKLILLDLDLPDMHGIKVLANILQDDHIKDIPVIIISADATAQQINRLINAGAKDYLTKPLDIIAFLRVVDEWM
jgi:CheY-like chemotaxis protein